MYRSPDRSLQLDYVKLESLVIADQHAAVNMYPGPVHTARHTLGQAPGQGPGATPRIHNLLKAASFGNVVNKQDIRFRAMEKHEHNLLSYSP